MRNHLNVTSVESISHEGVIYRDTSILTQVKNHLSVTSVKNGLHDSVICRDISILTQVKNWSRVLHVEQRTHVVFGVPSHVCTQRGEKELTHDTCGAQKSQIHTHTGENPHKRDTCGLSHITFPWRRHCLT